MQTLDSSGWSIFVVLDGKSSSDLRKSKTAPDEHPGPSVLSSVPPIPSFSPEGSLRRTQASEDEVEGLDVEVEGELPGMGSEADRIDLVLSLVLDPGVDGVLGEDIAL